MRVRNIMRCLNHSGAGTTHFASSSRTMSPPSQSGATTGPGLGQTGGVLFSQRKEPEAKGREADIQLAAGALCENPDQ
jgi:hypothetical protein